MLAREFGERQTPPLIEIPMTRLDMADYLGLTIETVSRTMTKLTSRGMIAASGRRAVVIRDLAKLAALAGENDEGDNDSAAIPLTRQAIWPH
jgi:CRP/FNR family transcriptional regulator